jgi:phosphatidyl-myo-inositol dimannoside synthase
MVRAEIQSQQQAFLGLFPWIGPGSLGGVQRSGRIAWDAIRTETACQHKRATLFCYHPFGSDLDATTTANVIVARSKQHAIALALRRPQPSTIILIWHIGLLKLRPCFRARSARLVLFLHGVEAWRRHDPLTRLLLRRVDCFLSNSDFTWRRFLDLYPHLDTSTHRTVYLGVDAHACDTYAPLDEAPAALTISRLVQGEDYKGHRELIGAWPLVLRRIPAAELWIAGDGDLRPELEQLVHRHGLGRHVRFFGQVSEEQKQDLLNRCRCLAMPSRCEGFGLVYLEAMRLGRPCLVSTLDAGREVVNPPEAGLAADPGDPSALADAICQLLTPGAEWERWSRQARWRYEQQFTAHHFQQRLIEALDLSAETFQHPNVPPF